MSVRCGIPRKRTLIAFLLFQSIWRFKVGLLSGQDQDRRLDVTTSSLYLYSLEGLMS